MHLLFRLLMQKKVMMIYLTRELYISIVVLVNKFFLFIIEEKLDLLFIVQGECQDESKGIESFYKCFEQRYEDCPVFFSGSLRNACESAFNSNVLQEVRLNLLL